MGYIITSKDRVSAISKKKIFYYLCNLSEEIEYKNAFNDDVYEDFNSRTPHYFYYRSRLGASTGGKELWLVDGVDSKTRRFVRS